MHLYRKSWPNLEDMRAVVPYKDGDVMILYMTKAMVQPGGDDMMAAVRLLHGTTVVKHQVMAAVVIQYDGGEYVTAAVIQ
jgi:hypothetical protein